MSDENDVIGSDEQDDVVEVLDNMQDYGEENISTQNVINSYIKDSIFTSGDLQTLHHASYTTSKGSHYVYSYITYQMSGTNNRETHIIIAKWTKSFENGYLQNQLKIYKNCCVLYVANTGRLGISTICKNPLKMKSVVLKNRIITEKGYCTYRQQYASINSSTTSKIVKCIIGWIPKLNKTFSSYQTLTGSAANDEETYSKSDHLNTVKAKSKAMYRVGDYMFLRIQCSSNTKKGKYYYKYTIAER